MVMSLKNKPNVSNQAKLQNFPLNYSKSFFFSMHYKIRDS